MAPASKCASGRSAPQRLLEATFQLGHSSMKQDDDFVRELLLEAEASDPPMSRLALDSVLLNNYIFVVTLLK